MRGWRQARPSASRDLSRLLLFAFGLECAATCHHFVFSDTSRRSLSGEAANLSVRFPAPEGRETLAPVLEPGLSRQNAVRPGRARDAVTGGRDRQRLVVPERSRALPGRRRPEVVYPASQDAGLMSRAHTGRGTGRIAATPRYRTRRVADEQSGDVSRRTPNRGQAPGRVHPPSNLAPTGSAMSPRSRSSPSTVISPGVSRAPSAFRIGVSAPEPG